MYLQILVGLVCLYGAFIQIAALRSPDVQDTKRGRSARKMIMVGLFVACLYIAYSVIYFGNSNVPFCLAVGLVSFGIVIQTHDVVQHGLFHYILGTTHEPHAR